MPIKFKFIMSDEFKAALKNPSKPVRNNLMKAIRNSLLSVQREVKKNVVPGWGAGIRVRNPYFTGRLNRSITIDDTKLKLLKGIVGANTIYAAIQEYGGEIRPVRAKALFVPMSRLGRKIGPKKGGDSILKYGEDFIFKQSVNIKPKGYFERGIDSAMPAITNYLTGAGVDIATETGFK